MISSLELARLCGVSQGTVDRALHGRPGVSVATKARIQSMAIEHGYRPNPVVRELLSGKSQILGALVPSMTAVFFMDFLQAVKEASDRFHLRLFITPVADRIEFLEALDDLAARRVSGVLAVPPEEGIRIPANIVRALPVATILSPTSNKSIPLFAPDERATGETAVEYLVNRGHSRILHVTFQREAHAILERTAGYQEAMNRRGLASMVCTLVDQESLQDSIDRYRPTALFCHNDRLALSTIRALEAMRISVPQDLSVLGVDNSPTFNLFEPHITTMSYPSREVALKAVRWLVEKVDERPISSLEIVEKGTVKDIRE